MMTAELADAPSSFPIDAEINRTGAPALTELSPPPALSPEEVTRLASTEYLVLDVRSAEEFGEGHVPGSINIGLGGQFAIWAGILIPMGIPIVIVSDSEEKTAEAVMRLARVGIESVQGHLAGGIEAWRDAGMELATVPQVSVDELKDLLQTETQLQVIDVRRPPEYQSGHVPRALHAPLSTLDQTAGGLPVDPSKPTAVICAGGYRSSAATSILQQHGFTNLMNITGGTSAWINAGYPVEKTSAK
jgi:hydroxyacylglutathione hydrolase